MAPATRLQAGARGLLVRRCLLPACELQRELARQASHPAFVNTSLSDLYLQPDLCLLHEGLDVW